jgi:peptidyl-prolyl cis-trans isomerase A (cyclophilin A)
MRPLVLLRLALLGLVSTPVACGKTEAPPEVKSDPPKASAPGPAARPSAATPPLLGGNALYQPERAKEKAPEKFKAKFTTTKGDFVIEVTRAWAPNGADRFYNLVKLGFYDGTKFYRAVEGFMVQWGINGDPSVNGAWYRAYIPDDPVVKGNKRGFVNFATAGKDMRTTQICVNYTDKNTRLDSQGFAAFGEVVEGMKVVDSLFKGYGEGAPQGKGPKQSRIQSEGNAYLEQEFPKLDAVKEAKIL